VFSTNSPNRLRLWEYSNFCYSTYLKQKLQAIKQQKLQLFTHLDQSIIDDDTKNAISIMLKYEPTLPLTPPIISHSRRRGQGPLHSTWLSRHRRGRPSTPSSSATAAIAAITGLVVAWCRLPPPSSSPLLPTADTTPPTTASPPPYLVLLPPLRPPPPPSPSRTLRPLDYPWRRHGPACGVDTLPPGPTWQVPLPHPPSSLGYGPIAPGPPSQPPQCLGLLSGGRR
jgi:hypothetical protein